MLFHFETPSMFSQKVPELQYYHMICFAKISDKSAMQMVCPQTNSFPTSIGWAISFELRNQSVAAFD